jgi:hypothetical protein
MRRRSAQTVRQPGTAPERLCSARRHGARRCRLRSSRTAPRRRRRHPLHGWWRPLVEAVALLTGRRPAREGGEQRGGDRSSGGIEKSVSQQARGYGIEARSAPRAAAVVSRSGGWRPVLPPAPTTSSWAHTPTANARPAVARTAADPATRQRFRFASAFSSRAAAAARTRSTLRSSPSARSNRATRSAARRSSSRLARSA